LGRAASTHACRRVIVAVVAMLVLVVAMPLSSQRAGGAAASVKISVNIRDRKKQPFRLKVLYHPPQ
jgi:hypothetical protein